MKKLVIISAMLFIALGLSAQNTTRTPNKERKTTVTQTKKETRAAKTETRQGSTNSKTVTPSNPSRENSSATPAKGQKSSSEKNRNSGNVERHPTNVTPAAGQNKQNTGTNSGREVRHPDNGTKEATPAGRTTTKTRTTTVTTDRQSKTRTPARTPAGKSTTVTGGNTSNTYDPKRGQTYTEQRRVYVTPVPRRVIHPAPHPSYVERPIEYRRIHNPYRMPPSVTIIWNENMYHNYSVWYPDFHLWYYPFGYSIQTVSSYDALGSVGEIARVYGAVYDTYYAPESDEFFLYFGGPYPYQDFSIVLNGKDARRFNRRPDRFFTNRYIAVTGLISIWEGKPEIDVKRRSQIDIY